MSSLEFLYSRPSAGHQPLRPLTHHQIMRLVAPFTAAGRRVDLRASDRSSRLIAFETRRHDALPALPTIVEQLRLFVAESGDLTLTRRLIVDGEGVAELEAAGAPGAELLARIDAVPITRQWLIVADVLLARSYRLRSPPAAESGAPPYAALTRAEARLAYGRVRLRVEEGLAGAPFEVTLAPADGMALHLPADFLAVADPAWRPLRATRTLGWKGSVRVPRREPKRTAAAEALVSAAVGHVTRTLARPPAAYHATHRRARWRAAFQRAAPLLCGLAVLLAMPALLLLPAGDAPGFQVVVFQLPPLLLILFFSMQELPTLEIPPLPRPLRRSTWVTPTGVPVNDREEPREEAADAG